MCEGLAARSEVTVRVCVCGGKGTCVCVRAKGQNIRYIRYVRYIRYKSCYIRYKS